LNESSLQQRYQSCVSSFIETLRQSVAFRN
jgi:hypothetical protein